VSPFAEMMLAVFTCSAFSTRNLAHKKKIMCQCNGL
jgi:hypothetical protein